MNKQFPFSPEGVNEWQHEVYAGGPTVIDSECTLIADDFVGWMAYRFSLDASQVQFLHDLGELTQLSYSASIRDTLQHGGEITLEKEEEARVAPTHAKNPKVVYKEQRNAAIQQRLSSLSEDSAEEQAASLKFRIEYPEEEG